MVGWREQWMERRDRKMLDTPLGIRVSSYGAEETKKTSRDGGMEEWRSRGRRGLSYVTGVYSLVQCCC